MEQLSSKNTRDKLLCKYNLRHVMRPETHVLDMIDTLPIVTLTDYRETHDYPTIAAILLYPHAFYYLFVPALLI